MVLLLRAPERAPERAPSRPVLDVGAHGSRTAIRTADGEITYAQLRERAADLAADVLGRTRRLVLIEGANHLDAVTAYLAALEHGHVALLVPEGRPTQTRDLVDAYDPDVLLQRDDDGRWRATERREEQRTRPAPGPCPAAEHVGLDGISQAGPALARQPAQQRPQHRDLPAAHRRRSGSHLVAHALLLRALRREQPPGVRCRAGPDRPLGRGRVLLGPVPRRGRDIVRRRPLHLRPAGPLGLRGARPADAALRHPGRRPAGPGSSPGVRRAGAPRRVGSGRDVRPDRGHSPDGLPAAPPRGHPTGRDRGPDPRRLVPARAGPRVPGAGHRRAGVRRAQRDDGVRRAAGRPGHRHHPDRAAHG